MTSIVDAESAVDAVTRVVARQDAPGIVRDISDWLEELLRMPDAKPSRRARAEDRGGRDIYLSMTGLPSTPELQRHLADILLSFADRGWSIHDVLRVAPSDNAKRLDDLQHLARYLLDTFRYSEHYTAYICDSVPAMPHPDFVAVSGKGVMIALPSFRSPDVPDTVIHFPPGDVCSAVEEAVALTVRSSTVLLKVAKQESLEWERLLHRTELIVGDRRQMRELFTTLSDPKSLLRREYEAEGFAGEALEEVMRLHSERVQAMYDQVGACRFMNIAERSSVERYIATGIRDRLGTRVSPAELREHVEQEIEWLDRFPNYHLGLSDSMTPLAFMIKAGKAMFEVIRAEGVSHGAAHSTVESEALKSVFLDQFEHVWGKIAPEFRRRDDVVDFLKSRLKESPYLT